MIPRSIVNLLALRLERAGITITKIIDDLHHSVLHAVCLGKDDNPILAEIFLHAAGDDVLWLLKMKDGIDCFALYFATTCKKINTIKRLLKFAGDQAPVLVLMFNADEDQITALGQAVISNEIEIATILLEAAGPEALQEIIELHGQVKSFMEIGDRHIELGVPAISHEMVDLLQCYREKYEKLDGH